MRALLIGGKGKNNFLLIKCLAMRTLLIGGNEEYFFSPYKMSCNEGTSHWWKGKSIFFSPYKMPCNEDTFHWWKGKSIFSSL